MYIYSENSDAETEIYRNLFYQKSIVQRVQSACLEGEECSGDLPIKTCEDNFVLIREGLEDKIFQNNNCVFIESAGENLTMLSDEFLFKLLKITP